MMIFSLRGGTKTLAGKPGSQPATMPTISFVYTGKGFNHEIRLMQEDGSGVIAVDKGSDVNESRPRWSPDGTMLGGHLKYIDNEYARMAMKADGSAEWAMVSDSELNAFIQSQPSILASSIRPQRFPNDACWLGNNAIVFPACVSYTPELYGDRLFFANHDGELWPLTDIEDSRRYNDGCPHWSAALNMIVFISDRSGCDELYAIKPDGTGLVQITDFRFPSINPGDESLFQPVWSPSGGQIALVVDFDAENYSRDILIIDVDLTQPYAGTGLGGRVTAIDPFKVGLHFPLDDSPAWSPTGDRLVFHRYASSNLSQIIIAEVASGEETVIAAVSQKPTYVVPDIDNPDWKPVP